MKLGFRVAVASGLIGLVGLSAPTLAHARCTPFVWQPIEMGELKAQKAAILLPVSIPGVAGPILMQLDTGSPGTLLYGKAFDKPPAESSLRPSAIRVGDVIATDVSIAVDAELGAPADPSKGTLGMDALHKGFVLDLINATICPLDTERPGWTWQRIERVNDSPVLTVADGSKTLRLLLDTGSSAFTLLSTAAKSPAVAAGSPVRTLKVPSFGRTLTVTELTAAHELQAFGAPLKLAGIYAFEDKDIEDQLSRAGIDGLIGLAAFSNGKLAFDFTRDRIGFSRR